MVLNNIQPLNPIFFELGPIHVYWYGVLIGLGIAVGYVNQFGT